MPTIRIQKKLQFHANETKIVLFMRLDLSLSRRHRYTRIITLPGGPHQPSPETRHHWQPFDTHSLQSSSACPDDGKGHLAAIPC